MPFRLGFNLFLSIVGNSFLIIFLSFFLFSCNNKGSKPDHKVWVDSIVKNCRSLMSGKNKIKAMSYIDSVYRVKTNLGLGDYWRKYSVKVEYYSILDTTQTQLLIDSMMFVLKGRELEYKYEYAHTLMVQGDLYVMEKKYAKAFQSYYNGGEFARKNGDSCSLSDFSQRLANIYYNQAAYSKAIEALKDSYRECEACPTNDYDDFRYRFELPQQVLNTIALSFEKNKQPDSAAFYYLKALDFIDRQYGKYPQKVYMSVARAVVEGNLGGVYVTMNKYADAVKYMQQSIRNNDQEGYAIEDAQLTKCKLAALFISLNNLKAADSLISQLNDDMITGRGKSFAHSTVKGKLLYLKWLFYDKTQQLNKAYKYLQLYKAYTDAVNQDRAELKKMDLDRDFKVHDQQFQLALLRKNDELKTAYLLAVLLFLVLAMSIAIVIWSNLKRSREHVAVLTRLNTQMNNTLTALETSQTDNSRIMAIVAHDLRSPISAMSMAASMIIKKDKLLSGNSYELLELIKTSGNSTLRLVNDLLSIHVSSDQPEKKQEDLKDLLQYCVELLRHKATAKKQELLLNGASVIMNMNRERLWRVMSNLIANAIKFSPEHTVISIRLEQQQQNALISVQDHGIGIPENLKDKIFEMNTSAKRKGTAGEESFGLGLAIAKQIVDGYGGKIWFESVKGMGSTFYVKLPLDN